MTDRYSTNQFYNFDKYETSWFMNPDGRDTNDNPAFIWPAAANRNSAMGVTTGLQRGYMRMLSQGYGTDAVSNNLARRRFHFQFNPDVLVRQVESRNDVQLWMNQDPAQFINPIPGNANFAFDFILNREAEVVSRKYRVGPRGDTKEVTANTVLPGDTLGDTKRYPPGQKPSTTDGGGYQTMGKYDPQSVVDIGVLADLFVFDQIIGQGMNLDILEKYYGKISNIANTYNSGVESRNAENSTRDEEDRQPEEETLKLTETHKFLTGNIGNSAFLVSQPVRIVFSSLFMVEGFISSTMVTFNKFNMNMVPTQCTVNVQMQAMYIGFATKNTFLTRSLELQLSEEQLASVQNDAAVREQQALRAVAKDTFDDIYKGSGGNDQAISVKDLLQGGDPITKLNAVFKGSEDVISKLKDGYIDEIVGTLSVKVTYKGLNGSVGPNSNIPVNTLVHSVSSSSLSIAKRDGFNEGTRLTKSKTFDIPKKTPVASEQWDQDQNAQWKVALVINFNLKTSGEAQDIIGNQFATFNKTVTTNQLITADDFTLHNIQIDTRGGNPYGS